MKKLPLLILFMLLMAFGMMPSASALTIDASALINPPWLISSTYWTGLQTSNADIMAAIAPYIGSAQELYKQNYGGAEEKPLVNAYTTNFTDTSNASIVWDGPSFISPPSYLLVKDGNTNPAWYLFDLNVVSWNGKETINLSNFWLGDVRGAISHVSLFGNVAVPEPTTLLLLGSGLVALGLIRRKLKA